MILCVRKWNMTRYNVMILWFMGCVAVDAIYISVVREINQMVLDNMENYRLWERGPFVLLSMIVWAE